MNICRRVRRCVAPTLLLLLLAWVPLRAAELPADSIYHLPVALVNQDARAGHLANRRGKPQLISMFYTSCPYVCPLIIDTLLKTQRALPRGERTRLDVLLVSFDPDRDTPARLKEVFVQRKLDPGSWTLACTDAADVRKLAAVLGIQYRALANGDVNHSSALVLLDAEGRMLARTDRIGEIDPDFVAAVQAALAIR